MNLGVLFSGGKDSNFALFEAQKEHDIKCLISLISENEFSYMFQSLGLDFIDLQAKALDIPLIKKTTKGEKEYELDDLKEVLIEAKKKYNIDGIVTGAILSVYQSSRIEKICDELNLWCFNPLWLKDQKEFLDELLKNNFEIFVVGVFSYPLDENFLGVVLDKNLVDKLKFYADKYKINPAGEGGELETFVLDSPIFKKKIIIEEFEKEYCNYSGKVKIKKIYLVKK